MKSVLEESTSKPKDPVPTTPSTESSTSVLNATSPPPVVSKSERLLGGRGGRPFDDYSPSIIGIKALWIRHGDQVDSLQVEYIRKDNSTFIADKHGGTGGRQSHIEFADGEVITEILMYPGSSCGQAHIHYHDRFR